MTATILAQGELFVVEDTSQTDFFNNPLAVEERIHSLIAAERLRERIEAEPPRHLDDYVQSGITVSSGVAAHPRDEQTFNDQFKTVDDLLYVAKRQGKNKVNYLPD